MYLIVHIRHIHHERIAVGIKLAHDGQRVEVLRINVYGWASWNGKKATLALRNGGNDAETYSFTLREDLNIPANVQGSIVLRKSFGEQDALEGLTEGEAIDVDQQLSVTLPGSSIFCFDGLDAAQTVAVENLELTPEKAEKQVEIGKTFVVTAAVAPADASFPALLWSSSDETVATVSGGLVVGVAEGEVTITATAQDGSGTVASIVLNVVPKVVEPYAINFDKDATPTNTGRYINTISFTAGSGDPQVLSVGSGHCYYDFTADEEAVLTCAPYDNLNVVYDITGGWMNGYVFVDFGNDGQFSFKEGSTDQSGTDVVSFSFYSGSFSDDTSGVNSAGTAISGGGRNTMSCPDFVAPSEAGDYRIRFKMDWNSVNPAGQLAADGTPTGSNGILANGGQIVDAILRVNGSQTGIGNVGTEGVQNKWYDLSGRRLHAAPAHGVYIQNNRKVVK